MVYERRRVVCSRGSARGEVSTGSVPKVTPWILELRCRSGIHVVAHADYPDDDYQWQKEVDLQRVLWDRARLMNNGNGIRGADHFWFGHTPLRHRLDRDNLHYIDTGAVFGGELTLVQLQ